MPLQPTLHLHYGGFLEVGNRQIKFQLLSYRDGTRSGSFNLASTFVSSFSFGYQRDGIPFRHSANAFPLAAIIMKYLLLIFFSSLANSLFSQIPDISNNTNAIDSSRSILIERYAGKYDFAMAYSSIGYWTENEVYHIVSIKNDSCFVIRYTVLDGETSPAAVLIKIIDKNSFDTLLNQLAKLEFWKLNNKALNERCWPNSDSTKACLSISDGNNDKFEILTPKAFMIIESYEPDEYFEKIPTLIQRKIFIDCRNLFKQFIARKE